jgi:protein-S-isoprenylcysteine O-methyltransferase Ste14
MARRRTLEDRTKAPIMLVLGGIVTLLGVVMLVLAIATDRLDEVSGRRGVPFWLLASLAVAFGILILWAAVRMRRRGAAPSSTV